MDECIHGLGAASACTMCNGRDERERADRDRIVARWAARYPGSCAMCGDEIPVGAVIQRTADERYVCGEH